MSIRIPRRSTCLKTIHNVLRPITKRHLHGANTPKPIPSPTPFVPDIPTFLKLIGRQTSQHASKFPSWESFFQNQSSVLRASGIEPARTRRYLLWWRDRYRRGDFGFGGDLTQVADGMAELRIVERDGKKVVVNSKPEDSDADLGKRQVGVKDVRILQPGVLSGPYLQHTKGSYGTVATLKIEEGMWEEKRGQKIAGGERKRKAREKADKRKREREEREKALGINQ